MKTQLQAIMDECDRLRDSEGGGSAYEVLDVVRRLANVMLRVEQERCKCPECLGVGHLQFPDEYSEQCLRCDGTGQINQ